MTTQKNKISKETSAKVIELYKQGKKRIDIANELNMWSSSVWNVITTFEKQNEGKFFNVDKYDNWIIPDETKH